MPLSWNEIRQNAIAFSREWTGAKSEIAEKQTFWNEFFQVFGIRRRTVAAFEEPVKNLSGDYGRIDLFWRGMLIVEHKSKGGDLGKAESQAFRYIQDLVREGRRDEAPRYVIVSDFARLALHDLEPDDRGDESQPSQSRTNGIQFPLDELYRHIQDFAFIPGYKQHRFEDQDPINLRAVRIMDDLHDALEDGGYRGHELERFLVRVLFCLFAEDTGIFEREAFHLYIENRTQPDGSDLGPQLARLFEVLNTPPSGRQKNLDDILAAFPYVNGELFAERLSFADFNRDMRNSLLACTRFDWSTISPAVFGSLFQGVMEPRERRQIGGHYTSERDIMKVIRPLFLDQLQAEFKRIKNNKSRLKQFHKKLAELRFLDPACGCGNFLVIAYRELRLLEMEVLTALNGRQRRLDIHTLSLVDVDAFHGIEISEWPARIAEVAMWLMDHQMNLKLSEKLGQYFVRLPLRKSPKIVLGNALRLDWSEIIAPEQCNYILGNPPFVGGKYQSPAQRADMKIAAGDIKGHGLLDYVAGWYVKAAKYIQNTDIVVCFVSTNSITQGEQVGALWKHLFQRFGLKIHFAHRTFPWESEARGKAHVHVVVIGFAAYDAKKKRIFECHNGNPSASCVENVSPYLVDGPDRAVVNRQQPLCEVPQIHFGNQPIDGGHFLLDRKERAELLSKEPDAKKFVRQYIGAREFINGEKRWCLWLKDATPSELRSMPEIMRRIKAVKEFRLASKRPATRELAVVSTEFAFVSHPNKAYLLIPSVSSEKRRYIPMAFMSARVIASNLCLIIPGAKQFHFGVLSSAMHMAWVRQVGGRLESRYRYSNKLVYNNFPWPQEPTDKQREKAESAASNVLDIRKEFLKNGATLADLYDPLAMPPKLSKAHAALDRAVDRCYRRQPFTSERQRVEFLFSLYDKLTSPLIHPARNKRRGRRV
ncbi:MAG: class I SAM-dependent DNA methyltransferase [Pirellulales bacterium]|nr:class I SAM-dependent DNA methyltransferase [Pirellulales bacterium]